MIGPNLVSPYLKRRLRSIEEVLAARKARGVRLGELGVAPVFSGRLVVHDAGRDRDADDAPPLPRDPL